MEFSILITITGNKFDRSYDGGIVHDVAICDRVLGPADLSDPGDSEYTYNADGYRLGGLQAMFVEAMKNDSPKDPQRLAEWADGRWGLDGDLWWATLSDYQNSGILDRPALEYLLDRIGATADSTPTMGTLGGPANPIGIAPDINYEVESQSGIYSIRVTPLSDRINTQDRWDKVVNALLSLHGNYEYPKAAEPADESEAA